MHKDQITLIKAVKFASFGFAVLMLMGIATLMYIASDKDEDITGIVAPALFLVVCSLFVAIIAAVSQWRLNTDSFSKEK